MLTPEQKEELRHAIEYYVKHAGISVSIADVLDKVALKSDAECLQFIEDCEFNKGIDSTPKPVKRVLSV